MNQARRKLTPILPDSSTFNVPESYQTTSIGEQFLFYDAWVSRRKRMLLFGSPKQLQLLFDSSTIMLDGTFLATPPFFNQVFTIHALKFDTGTGNICFHTCSTFAFHIQAFHVCLVPYQTGRNQRTSNFSRN